MASQDDRHTTGHTKRRTGGVKTARLGAVQRRVLTRVLEHALEKTLGSGQHEQEAWVPWRPKRDHTAEVTNAERVALSNAVKALEDRRLLLVRRHETGRAYAVRLTVPGHELAWSLYMHNGLMPDQRRKRLADMLPAEIRTYVVEAHRELRRANVSEERRAHLERFTELYSEWIADEPAPDGTRGASPQTLRGLVELHTALTT